MLCEHTNTHIHMDMRALGAHFLQLLQILQVSGDHILQRGKKGGQRSKSLKWVAYTPHHGLNGTEIGHFRQK